MPYTYSITLIALAADRADANLLACALGYDALPGSTFTVPLAPEGAQNATHYGEHTWATEEFSAMLGAAAGGALPAIQWADYGLTAERVAALMQAMITGVANDGTTSWGPTLAANGLTRFVGA